MGKGMNRVEYIKKTKYENQLPPPPFGPKLVDYNLKFDSLLTTGSLSAIFLQSELEPEVDGELGIPIDLTSAPEQFFEGGEARMQSMVYNELDDQPLDPEDEELLGEPEISGVLAKQIKGFSVSSNNLSAPSSSHKDASDGHTSEIGVGTSFLRRTAYMTSEMRRASKRKSASTLNQKEKSQQRIEREIQRINATFVDARAPLETLKHPKNDKLKAVSSEPLLPDAKVSDLQFIEVRLLGSSSLKSFPEIDTDQLRSTVFLQNKLPEEVGGDNVSDWLSMFVANKGDDSEELHTKLIELNDTLSEEETKAQEEKLWQLKKVQDADLTLIKPKTKFEEIVISYDDKNKRYLYLPISARANLRRRRVAPRVQNELRDLELDVDNLELGLKELTPQETIERDEIRSIYDPVRFG